MSGMQHVVEESLGTKTMDADFETEIANVDNFHMGSADVTWAGSDADTSMFWEVSNDKENWCKIDGSDKALPAGTGHQAFEFTRFAHWWLRANFTAGSATAGIVTIKLRKKSERP